MKMTMTMASPTIRSAWTLLLCGLLLAGCASVKQPQAELFDMGMATPAANLPALPPMALAEVNTPEWLDSPAIFYRLAYDSARQPRPYANSRWSMPPAQLFAQRLKSRMGQAGGTLLSASDGAAGIPVLHLEADEISQIFDSPERSSGMVAMRLSVLHGRRLLGQKSFVQRMPAPSADAAGGVEAIASASDAVIADMLQWLASLDLRVP
jgi:cholesterol transport system auxiliary component